MVRRAGRSKACITCLRRRKGCDLQKPSCGQCRKGSIQCEGYVRPVVFKNTSLPPATPRANSTPSAQEPGTSIILHDSLTRLAYQSRLIELFWRSYLPNGQALPSEVAFISNGGWIDAMQASPHGNDVGAKTILALSLAVVGRQDKIPWMRELAQKYYGEAMHGISQTMIPHMAKRDRAMQVLPVVRSLSLFESIQVFDTVTRVDQAYRWQVHNLGESALLEGNPPTFYAVGQAHRLFVDSRLNLTITALITRKRTFFSHPEWKTVPWMFQSKTPKDHILDVFCDIPTLYELMDDYATIDKSHETKETKRYELIAMCRDLESRLQKWCSVFHERFNSVNLEVDSADFDKPQALVAAHILNLYWITGILIYRELRSLLGADHPGSVHAHMLSDLYCQNIVRAVAVFLRSATGLFRLYLATTPIVVVIRYFHAPGSEGRLLKERETMSKYLEMPECEVIREFLKSIMPGDPWNSFMKRPQQSGKLTDLPKT